MPESPPEDGSVGALHPRLLHEVIFLRSSLGEVAGPQEVRAKHGNGRKRDEEGCYQRETDSQCEWEEERPHDPLNESERREDHDSSHGRCEDRRADLFRGLERRAPTLPSSLDVAVEVLEHDDRVVDYPPNGDGKTAQRHEIEGHVLPRHEQHACEDAQGNGQSDHQRRTQRVEQPAYHRRTNRQHEYEDDRHCEYESEHGLAQEGVDLPLDVRSLVEHYDDFNAGREVGQSVQGFADCAGDVDGVRFRFLDDGHAHAGLAVGARDAGRDSAIEIHVRNVSQTDWSGLRHAHDEVFDRLDGVECMGSVRRDRLSAFEDDACGQGKVVLGEGGGDLE